uniref:uncharacterized protein LOC122585469 n=1 Tax=Erigeron canadensis TaxID=72917 RepID=UPI001CB95ACB|nr:uncharacterized protein LOC122585469 [Erigeron canadensis]
MHHSMMFQPPFEMENGHNIDMSAMNNLQMVSFNDNDPEVIARRIKNRERQRRYRARKRQEADLKRVCMISQPIQPQVNEVQVNNTPVDFVTRVYSPRNWKKDARRAHLLKQQQQHAVTSASANMYLQLSGNQSDVNVDTREQSSTPGGRNWKAEARNKRK